MARARGRGERARASCASRHVRSARLDAQRRCRHLRRATPVRGRCQYRGAGVAAPAPRRRSSVVRRPARNGLRRRTTRLTTKAISRSTAPDGRSHHPPRFAPAASVRARRRRRAPCEGHRAGTAPATPGHRCGYEMCSILKGLGTTRSCPSGECCWSRWGWVRSWVCWPSRPGSSNGYSHPGHSSAARRERAWDLRRMSRCSWQSSVIGCYMAPIARPYEGGLRGAGAGWTEQA